MTRFSNDADFLCHVSKPTQIWMVYSREHPKSLFYQHWETITRKKSLSQQKNCIFDKDCVRTCSGLGLKAQNHGWPIKAYLYKVQEPKSETVGSNDTGTISVTRILNPDSVTYEIRFRNIRKLLRIRDHYLRISEIHC